MVSLFVMHDRSQFVRLWNATYRIVEADEVSRNYMLEHCLTGHRSLVSFEAVEAA